MLKYMPFWTVFGVCFALAQAGAAEAVHHCGPDSGGRVLVAYATRAGSTQGVAEAIADELCKAGLPVDLADIDHIEDIKPYRAFVIGSGIRMAKWLPEAADFVEKNQSRLKAVPVAFFTVCLAIIETDPEKRKAVVKYTEPQRKQITPIEEAFFAGVGDYSKLSFFSRLMAKVVKMQEGDFRDWNAIRKWARGLKDKLKAS